MSGTDETREALVAAIVQHLRDGHVAGGVITAVAQRTGADITLVVGAMWDAVEDGLISYSSGARLNLLPDGVAVETAAMLSAPKATSADLLLRVGKQADARDVLCDHGRYYGSCPEGCGEDPAPTDAEVQP